MKAITAVKNILVAGLFLSIALGTGIGVDALMDARGFDGQWFGAAAFVVSGVAIIWALNKKGSFFN